MGQIKKVLAMDELPRRSITPAMIWTDLCENVHLHYRNVRFDFSEVEFAQFRAAMHHLGMAVECVANDYGYREGDPNFLVQQKFDEPLKPDSDYYPNRALIELQRDGTVHFHYRDLRLHFSEEEFETIARAFAAAILTKRELKNDKFPYRDIKKKRREWIDIQLIQPYDEGHRPGVFDKDHRDGIEYCKKLIEEGKTIRPILVDTRGQRLDGFKRYFAHLELGKTTIECIVDPHGRMGGQHNQSMLDDEHLKEAIQSMVERQPENDCHKCKKCGRLHFFPVGVEKSKSSWTCEGCGHTDSFHWQEADIKNPHENGFYQCANCKHPMVAKIPGNLGKEFSCKKCGHINMFVDIGSNEGWLVKNERPMPLKCFSCNQPHYPENSDATVVRWECKNCGVWNKNDKAEGIVKEGKRL